MKDYISASAFWIRQIIGISLLLGAIIFPFFGKYDFAISCSFILCTLVVIGFFLPRSNLGFDLSIEKIEQRNIQSFVNGSSYAPFFGIRWYFFSSEVLRRVEEHNRKVNISVEIEKLKEFIFNPNPYRPELTLAPAKQMFDLDLGPSHLVASVMNAEMFWRDEAFKRLKKSSIRCRACVGGKDGYECPGPGFPVHDMSIHGISHELLTSYELNLSAVEAEEALKIFFYLNRVVAFLYREHYDNGKVLQCMKDALIPEMEPA